MYTGTFGAASNRAFWSWSIEIFDPTTDAVVDLTGASVEVAIGEQQAKAPTVEASTTNGKVVIDAPATAGIFSVTFPRSDMERLEAGHYELGIVVTFANGDSVQIAKGTLSIYSGVVPQS